jgi:hypothetical protein
LPDLLRVKGYFNSRMIHKNRPYVSQKITITRTPGPNKTLNLVPVELEEMESLIKQSNDWETSFVLKDILIFTYVNDVPTSINNFVLMQYFPNEKRETTLTEEEMESYITTELGISLV